MLGLGNLRGIPQNSLVFFLLIPQYISRRPFIRFAGNFQGFCRRLAGGLLWLCRALWQPLAAEVKHSLTLLVFTGL